MAGTLVAEALAKGDMGLAVATLAPGAVATAIGLWGTDEQQQTYLPAFTGDDVPAAALALMEPAVLFDVLNPTTTAPPTTVVQQPQPPTDPPGQPAPTSLPGPTQTSLPPLPGPGPSPTRP